MILTEFYLYVKDLSEPKNEHLIKKRENAFIECFNTMDDVYENINDYNQRIKGKKIIVFYDMIADIMTNKKFQAIIKELFVGYRKLNIPLVFITQSYFTVPKNIRLSLTHLIMKVNNRRELQNIGFNHPADIDYKDVMKIYRKCTKEPFNILTIHITLTASNPLRFRNNLFDSYKNDSN